MDVKLPSLGLPARAWFGSLALGLTLAACGGQADVAIGSASPVEPESTTSTTTTVPVETDESESLDTEAEPVTTTLPTSPLAEVVIELPSALPEVALVGVGEPIGVQPRSISLPTLGVDGAQIVPVGLEENGELEVPGADTVGWYEFGAGVDGGKGSTVLAAHIAYNGENGVFRNLVDMEPGQTLSIERDGETLEYVVESVADYDKWELPIDDLFSESSEERVVLITCGGSFNDALSSYEDNTVVVAVPAA